MLNAFCYVKADTVEEIIECGLKLQDHYVRQVRISGLEKKCILAYLNPADCQSYHDEGYSIIKVRLPKQATFVGEGAYFEASNMEEYEKSLILLSDYHLSMYRKPECLITSTLLPDQISSFDRRRDEPILYESSEEIYLSRFFKDAKEADERFRDYALEAYYDRLAEKGDLIKEDFFEYCRYIDEKYEKSIIIRKWR